MTENQISRKLGAREGFRRNIFFFKGKTINDYSSFDLLYQFFNVISLFIYDQKEKKREIDRVRPLHAA